MNDISPPPYREKDLTSQPWQKWFASIQGTFMSIGTQIQSILTLVSTYLDASISSRLGSIKSIQSGTITIGGSNHTTNTATITAVDMNKSILLNLGFNTDGTTTDFAPILIFTDSTTITATRKLNSSTNTTASFMVMEFN